MKIKKVTPAYMAQHEKKHGGVIYVKTKPIIEPPKDKVLKIETQLLLPIEDDAMTLKNNEVLNTSDNQHSVTLADDNSDEDKYQNHRLSSL